MDWFIGKARRKDKDATAATTPDEVKAYLNDEFAQERILGADFTALVVLPNGVDQSEWLASHTISFFEHVNILYGCISEFCQTAGCATMPGSGYSSYQWVDDKGKKIKCTASQYIDYVMTYSQKCINDESVFPTKYGNVFPNSFETIVRKIHRLLLHVITHIYQCHCREIILFKLHGHLNTVFYHFHLFNKQFNLIEEKEMEALENLFQRLHHYAIRRLQFEAEAAAMFSQSPDGLPAELRKTDSGVMELMCENKENVDCDSYPPMAFMT
jgi:hypothetical protein